MNLGAGILNDKIFWIVIGGLGILFVAWLLGLWIVNMRRNKEK